MYYHSDIRQYMQTYRDSSKTLSDDGRSVDIGGESFSSNDFDAIMEHYYIDSYYDWILHGLEELLENDTSSPFASLPQ